MTDLHPKLVGIEYDFQPWLPKNKVALVRGIAVLTKGRLLSGYSGKQPYSLVVGC